MPGKPFSSLPTFDESDDLVVVIETPKGSRNKYAWSDDYSAFELKGVLPEGSSFPFDFGLIPSTEGEDGDPLDILLLLDTPAFPGCVATARLIGAIKAEQRERDGSWERNDRLVGVATHAHTHAGINSLDDLRPGMIDEITGFFEHYNRLRGREFRPLGCCGADEAMGLVRDGMKAAEGA